MTEVLTPDFDSYRWLPIVAVDGAGPMVSVRWADGLSLDCFALWLFENSLATSSASTTAACCAGVTWTATMCGRGCASCNAAVARPN